MISFGNDELAGQPLVKEGALMQCRCGRKHRLRYGTDECGRPSATVGFINCGKHSYLASVGGRSVVDILQKRNSK